MTVGTTSLDFGVSEWVSELMTECGREGRRGDQRTEEGAGGGGEVASERAINEACIWNKSTAS